MSRLCPRLLVRCDAGPGIGAGHAVRCLSLAQEWIRRGGEAVFLMTASPGPLIRQIEASGVRVVMFEAERGSEQDARELRRLASLEEADWVVLDGYAFDLPYQRSLRVDGLRVMVLDDHGYAEAFAARVVLNQNLGVEASFYEGRAPEASLLLGSRYAMLRREFLAAVAEPPRSIPPLAQRLLVTMGAADPHNTTSRVLQALRGLGSDEVEVRVVVGGSNPHERAIRRAAEACPCKVTLLKDVRDMPALIGWADIALSAAGSTCWELMALGTPALVTSVADNQIGIARALDDHGAGIDLGCCHDLSEERLVEEVAALLGDRRRRAEMARRGRLLIDGRGAERVVGELLGCLAVDTQPRGAA